MSQSLCVCVWVQKVFGVYTRACLKQFVLFVPFVKSQETIFIIFTQKVDDQSAPEVEFSSENVAPKKVSGTLENEYTISVTAPGEYLQQIMWPHLSSFDGRIEEGFKSYLAVPPPL